MTLNSKVSGSAAVPAFGLGQGRQTPSTVHCDHRTLNHEDALCQTPTATQDFPSLSILTPGAIHFQSVLLPEGSVSSP